MFQHLHESLCTDKSERCYKFYVWSESLKILNKFILNVSEVPLSFVSYGSTGMFQSNATLKNEKKKEKEMNQAFSIAWFR